MRICPILLSTPLPFYPRHGDNGSPPSMARLRMVKYPDSAWRVQKHSVRVGCYEKPSSASICFLMITDFAFPARRAR